jgi:carbon storage regulator
MLVLARKSSEEIKIGDNIVVKVISIRGGQVKLGIEAPRGVRVSRVERGGRLVRGGDAQPPLGSDHQHPGERQPS